MGLEMTGETVKTRLTPGIVVLLHKRMFSYSFRRGYSTAASRRTETHQLGC